jgi:hypothetical protein
VPVVGVLLGTLLLGAGLLFRRRGWEDSGLLVMAVSGVAAGVTYLSGEGAEERVEDTLVAAGTFIERHESAAAVAVVLALITVLVAAATLFFGRKQRPLPKALLALSLLAGLGTTGALAWVANSGGQIEHPTIRTGSPTAMEIEREHDR